MWWVVVLLWGCGDAPVAGTDEPLLRTSGNRIVDENGRLVRLLGVNRSGTEYSCIQGLGIFDGPSDDASLAAIRTWKANAVRVPMNEDCWLAINGANLPYAGASYQQAIADYATRLLAHGLYPILELHWTAPGNQAATSQEPMPDRDHSIDFWSQVARRFRGERRIVFELFNEPFPDSNQDTVAAWICWRDGGSCPGQTFLAAGMEELVSAVRSAGAQNLILLGGVQYSNSLSRWLAFSPTDPTGNLAAAWHIYNFNGCNTQSCYNSTTAVVAAKVPLVATEIGEDDCSGNFISPLMNWLDGKQSSYLAWTWDTWDNCLALITNYDGTPNGAYGQTFQSHLIQVAP